MKKITTRIKLEILRKFKQKFEQNFKTETEKADAEKAEYLIKDVEKNNF
jgi:hypothetical protein